MSLNKRGTGERARILAAGTVTGGTPRYEAGYFGIPVISTTSGNYYEMDLVGEHEVPLTGSPAIGDPVYLTRATQALGLVAGAGNTPIGKVSALPAGGFGAKEPPSGKMWIILLPQLAVQP